MNFENSRDAILHFILKRESIFKHLYVFCLSLLSFIVINKTYGYMSVLNNEWLAVVLSVLCAFIPIGFVGIILFAFLSVHLLAFSVGICILFIMMWIMFFILSAVCGAKGHYNLMLFPVFYTIHVPFLIPIYEGYFGKRRNAIPLVGASVIAFFLRTVKLSEQVIKNNDDELGAFTLLKDNMFANLNFYLFVIAVATMFLIVSICRFLPIKGAWFVAGIFSVIVEFLMILIGYLFTGGNALIGTLIISNLITLAFVLIICVVFSDIKVNHRRVLNIEDDDYNYYVICTPKVRVEKTNKRVVRITRSKKEIEEENRKLETIE